MKIYTLTTEDEEGTKTYAFATEHERDQAAFKWMLRHHQAYEQAIDVEVEPPKGTIAEAYEAFGEVAGFDLYMWYDTHDIDLPQFLVHQGNHADDVPRGVIDAQEADLSAVGSEAADLQDDTPKTAEGVLQRLIDGLADMIEGGRLEEHDCPEDYDWLHYMIEKAKEAL